jgi:hypothetical protein
LRVNDGCAVVEDKLEQWMPQEIGRLQGEANTLQSQADAKRAEAEALQRALLRYLESKRHKASTPNHGEPQPASNGADSHPERQANARKRAPKPKKQELALAHVKNLGERGVTVSELHQQFTAPTLQMTANATRAMLWNLKQDGRVEQRDGRYYYRPTA